MPVNQRVRRVLTVSGYLAIGGLLTYAATAFAFALPAGRVGFVLGLVLVPLWYLAVFGGTKILPSSITIPYDPVGHPALHVIGLVANALYLAALAYAVWALIKRWRRR